MFFIQFSLKSAYENANEYLKILEKLLKAAHLETEAKFCFQV